MNENKELREIIENGGDIVFFGGAGVSTESGIPDFRGAQGMFSSDGGRLSPEEILHRDFFLNNTSDFYKFYFAKMIYEKAKPNAAHLALVELERQGRLKAVITQNIDGLHQMAGSRNVIELHGSVHRNFCMRCHAPYTLEYMKSQGSDPVPRCAECGGIVKPDVVLYGEALNGAVMSAAVEAIGSADIMIVAGTSLVVYPAAGLTRHFKGSKLILINKSETSWDSKADLVLRENVAQVLEIFRSE